MSTEPDNTGSIARNLRIQQLEAYHAVLVAMQNERDMAIRLLETQARTLRESLGKIVGAAERMEAEVATMSRLSADAEGEMQWVTGELQRVRGGA